jgi:adenosylhomocysteine nucleosidase
MVGIVYATRREADPFLGRIDAESLTSRPFLLFRGRAAGMRPCIAVISGMGKVAAAMAAVHLVLDRRVSFLINAGLCGRLSVNQRWDVGDLLRIGSAVEGDCDRFGRGEAPVDCDRRWFGRLNAARLVTCDRPVFDPAWRAHLAESGELADMEGAAVARVAGLYGIPCAMVKGISDAADESGRRELADNIDRVSARIADALVRELAVDKGS